MIHFNRKGDKNRSHNKNKILDANLVHYKRYQITDGLLNVRKHSCVHSELFMVLSKNEKLEHGVNFIWSAHRNTNSVHSEPRVKILKNEC